jgi:sarcosine oxidase
MPVFIIQDGENGCYGMPAFGQPGFKIGNFRHRDEFGTPEDLRRDADAMDEALLRPFVERFLPAGHGELIATSTCLYTNSPDENFIIDKLSDRISVATGFTGYGYKFASAVGELLAGLATGERDPQLETFALHRFVDERVVDL